MKKTLIAVSVLAACGAAMAQSSVTVYGVADVFVGSIQTTSLALVPVPPRLVGSEQRQTVVDSGGLSGSRWGLRGSEDLGGGLKANFVLESGFNISTGAGGAAPALFDRQAFVGLGSNWGAISLGRHYGAYYDMKASFLSAQGNGPTFDATNGVPLAPLLATYAKVGTPTSAAVLAALQTNQVGQRIGAWSGYQARINNSIRYETPNISGFKGVVVYGLGEDKNTPAGTNASKNASLSLTYANGPLAVGLAHQDDELTASKGFHVKNTAIGGNYDFGIARVFAAYNQANYTGLAKQHEWSVGVRAPLGATTLVAQYAHSDGDDLGMSQSLGMSAEYGLSKRTTAYAAFNQTRAFENLVKNNVFGLGVRHAF
jgi:predicted porin